MKKIIALFLLMSMLLCLTACKDNEDSDTSDPKDNAVSADEMFTERDYTSCYDADGATRIALTGASAEINGSGASVNGNVITLTDERVYIISGRLTEGFIVVDADGKKPMLVLENAEVNTAGASALYIKSADKVVLTLAEGSSNILTSSGDSYSDGDTELDGAVYSRQDLTVNGSGALTVTSAKGNGIVCNDDFVITGGELSITAALHGIDANDSVRVSGCGISITAEKDGIRAENNENTALGFVYFHSGVLAVESVQDGISASAYLQIDSGDYSITTTGNASALSAKGIKATDTILISGGAFRITSTDDAIHSNSSITIDGDIDATLSSGDDGIHADDTVTLNGGSINILKSYEGVEGLHVLINGGKLSMKCSDDGINAAGGADSSGLGGLGNDVFYGGPGGHGGHGGRPGNMGQPGGVSSSDGSIVITGGDIYINAYGDGIDANGTLEISGGKTVVCGPTVGDTSVLDYDVSATITGGTFIGTGSYSMAQSFSAAEQGVIACTVGNNTAGTRITVCDADGELLLEYSPTESFQILIFSSPSLVKTEQYNVTVGSIEGTITA